MSPPPSHPCFITHNMLSSSMAPSRDSNADQAEKQRQKIREEEEEEQEPEIRPRQLEDLWSTILSQNYPLINSNAPLVDGSCALPPLYVHPMVMRSSSSLSDKSLEICTESLGSETGSDGFSSYPSSYSDHDHDDDNEPPDVEHWRAVGGGRDELRVCSTVMYNQSTCRKVLSSSKSFPPPLPSLADRDDGSNIQIRSRRQDGRLVVEAVSVSSQTCFRARRQDGRLFLTLAAAGQSLNESEGEEDDDDEAEEEEEEEEEEYIGQDWQKQQLLLQQRHLQGDGKEEAKVHLGFAFMEDFQKVPAAARMAMDVPKLWGLTKSSSQWNHQIHRLNKDVTTTSLEEAGEEEKSCGVARLIPTADLSCKATAPAPSTTVTLNAYECCCWRSKPTPVEQLKPPSRQAPCSPLKNTVPVRGNNYNISINNNNNDDDSSITFIQSNAKSRGSGGRSNYSGRHNASSRRLQLCRV